MNGLWLENKILNTSYRAHSKILKIGKFCMKFSKVRSGKYVQGS